MTNSRTSDRLLSLAGPVLLLTMLAGLLTADHAAGAAPKPNVLIITVDDMNADSLGAFGCKLPDTSPTIDDLAKLGMRFNRAHVVVGNCWSNGTRIMATATSGTPTYRRMAELAKTDSTIHARHELYQHRVPEELYDIQRDPDCLNNLIHSPEHQQQLNTLRAKLEQWMVQTKDGMLPVFRQRDDAAAREAYVVAQEKEAEARKARGRSKAKRRRALP